MSVPPSVDLARAQELLANPSAETDSLIAVAYHHPALRPAVAAHPNASPELLSWLDSFGDPAASAAVAARRAQPGSPAAAQPATQAAVQPPLPQPPAAYPQPQSGLPPAAPTGAAASGTAPPAAYPQPGQAQPPTAAIQPTPTQPPAAYPYATPAGGPPSQVAPAAQPKPKRKGLMVGLIAGVVVVVLAVAAVLLVPKLFGSTDSDDRATPNFLNKPTLGPEIDVTEGLPEGTYLDSVTRATSPDQVVVLLSNGDCSEERCEYSRWWRGISLTKNEIMWTFALEDLGFDNPSTWWLSSLPAGQLGFGVYDQNDRPANSDGPVLVPGILAVLDSATGELVSSAEIEFALGNNDDLRIWGLNHGTMVVEPVAGPDGEPTIAGFSTADLSIEVWNYDAYVGNDAISREYRQITDDWVLTPAGYLAVEDGSLAPWGSDVDLRISPDGEVELPRVHYTLLSKHLLRVAKDEDGASTCMPWDMDTDQAKWAEPVDCTNTSWAISPDGLVSIGQGPTRSPESSTITYGLDTGEELWENLDGTPLAFMGETLVVAVAPDEETWTLALVDPTNGETIKEFDIPSDSGRIFGTEVLYVASLGDSRRLEAYSTNGSDADPLWTIKLGQEDRPIQIGSHLLIWNKQGIRQLEG